MIELIKLSDGSFGVRGSYNDKYYDICDGNWVNEEEFICSVDGYFGVID